MNGECAFYCTIHSQFILVTLIVPRLFGVAFTQPDKVRQNEKDDRLWYIYISIFIIHPATIFS
jgi:hypothetical protein